MLAATLNLPRYFELTPRLTPRARVVRYDSFEKLVGFRSIIEADFEDLELVDARRHLDFGHFAHFLAHQALT